jgi:hypothetical protein
MSKFARVPKLWYNNKVIKTQTNIMKPFQSNQGDESFKKHKYDASILTSNENKQAYYEGYNANQIKLPIFKKDEKVVGSQNPNNIQPTERLLKLQEKMNQVEADKNIKEINITSLSKISSFRKRLLQQNPDLEYNGIKAYLAIDLENFFKDQE